METVINPKVAELGKPVYRIEDIPTVEPDAPRQRRRSRSRRR